MRASFGGSLRADAEQSKHFPDSMGNPSAWAAGALFVYLAWYDAGVMWKRLVAAAALAFATSLKITPVIYGLLYLRGRLFSPERWPREEIFVAAVSFVVLFNNFICNCSVVMLGLLSATYVAASSLFNRFGQGGQRGQAPV